METYNLGKIEILRDPDNELKGIFSRLSHGKNRGFTNIYGYNKNNISEALDNLGFRLPTIKECVYLYSLFKKINEFGYTRFWVYTEIGNGILIINNDNGNNYIWSNPPESLKYILFAVNGPIPS